MKKSRLFDAVYVHLATIVISNAAVAASFTPLGDLADGNTIVGFSTNPDGLAEAWMANISPVPLPISIWLFGSGLLGLIGITRRKKA